MPTYRFTYFLGLPGKLTYRFHLPVGNLTYRSQLRGTFSVTTERPRAPDWVGPSGGSGEAARHLPISRQTKHSARATYRFASATRSQRVRHLPIDCPIAPRRLAHLPIRPPG